VTLLLVFGIIFSASHAATYIVYWFSGKWNFQDSK
jgi:hypothetical protein